jgi:2-polyprenyl-3-methyl-5-hydroxy-6-metoxy-1,4-benzoquinol methylase
LISRKYKIVDGIVVFHDCIDEGHADYKSQGLDILYREEERHFWFLARKQFIASRMREVVGSSSKIIEVGAGTGNVSQFLKREGFDNIAVGEMHINGLRYAKSYGIDDCYQFDLLRTPFENEFDAVCCFDVLEHIKEDEKALVNISQMLKDSGNIVLTVPSHQWLWNRDDVLAGHKKRYTRKSLIGLLEAAGFDVVVARYFFMSIVPLLLLRKIIYGCRVDPAVGNGSAGDIALHPFLSKILLYVSLCENKLNKYLPNFFGGSLLVIARKSSVGQ